MLNVKGVGMKIKTILLTFLNGVVINAVEVLVAKDH